MTTSLENGIAAVKAGNKAQAFQYLRQAVVENPKDKTAWLWISTLVDDPEKKSYCFQKVLEVDPNNQYALRGMNSIAKPAIEPKQGSQPESALQPKQVVQSNSIIPPDSTPPQSYNPQAPAPTNQTICDKCLQLIPVGKEKIITGKDNTTITLCPNCASAINKALNVETENPNIIGALFFAFGAALISALIWYGTVVVTDYQLGIVAIAVGWIVAQATTLGSGRKRGFTIQLISVIATAFAMVLSEYLIVRYFLVQIIC